MSSNLSYCSLQMAPTIILFNGITFPFKAALFLPFLKQMLLYRRQEGSFLSFFLNFDHLEGMTARSSTKA